MPTQEPKKSYEFFAPKVFIRTFGWPMVQVPHDDFGDNKTGKWLEMKGLG